MRSASELEPAADVDERAERPTAKLVDSTQQPSAACDARILFAARFVRLFAFAAMTVVLLLLLTEAGIEGENVGLLLTLIMVGDLGISFFLTTRADRLGRKRTLLAGTALALFSALIFGTSTNFALLLIAMMLSARCVGVVSGHNQKRSRGEVIDRYR